ncbi:MAG: class I SAM-dependent methyltransferase, partial [Thermoanaerobaculia bacterium]
MISDVLRSIRTFGLRLAGPLDRAWLLATRRGHLPPLWLRRHTGSVSAFESAARETSAFLDRLGLLNDVQVVLDVGCGAGAMVEELRGRLPQNGRYVGFDVHAPSIRWCRSHWASDPRLSFEVAPVASPYGSASGRPIDSYRFPVEDGAADLVLAKSVYTHLMAEEARHYLAETRRVLRPGRPAVVTAFLYEAGTPGVERAFPHAAGDGMRVRSRGRPTAAVAWHKATFVSMIEEAGLHLQWHSEG